MIKAIVLKSFKDASLGINYKVGDEASFADEKVSKLVSLKLVNPIQDAEEKAPKTTKKPTKKEAKNDNTRKMQKSIED